MMLSGSGDSSAVFSLLAALSDPEAAKARLKEISEASGIYQKIIEDFREETKKTNTDLEEKKVDVEAKLAEAIRITNEFDASHEVRAKQLTDLTDVLAKRQATIEAKEATQTDLDTSLREREKLVIMRELNVTHREASVQEAEVVVQAMRQDYETKISALKAAMGQSTSYVMKADAISFGTLGAEVGNGSV